MPPVMRQMPSSSDRMTRQNRHTGNGIAVVGVEHKTQRRRNAPDRRRETLVAVGKLGGQSAEIRLACQSAELPRQRGWRAGIGLGKQHIDRKRGRFARGHRFDQTRHRLARPWPRPSASSERRSISTTTTGMPWGFGRRNCRSAASTTSKARSRNTLRHSFGVNDMRGEKQHQRENSGEQARMGLAEPAKHATRRLRRALADRRRCDRACGRSLRSPPACRAPR